MTPELLLRTIAETAYNVGYSAKKNLATLDIIEKLPGWIGLISLGVGIFSLFVTELAVNWVSASFILIGVASTSLNAYAPDKEKYADNGTKLTALFHELRIMYYEIKSLTIQSDMTMFVEKLKLIQSQAIQIQSTKQVFLSDWYAHYKFFWQMQIGWIDEVRPFSFWRDKLPLSFTITLVISAFYSIYWVINNWFPLL
jgi:hypothetical protein